LGATIKKSLAGFFGELEKIGQASGGGVAPPINPGDSGGAGMNMPKPPSQDVGGGLNTAGLGLGGGGPKLQVSTQPQQPMSATGTPPPGAPTMPTPQTKAAGVVGALAGQAIKYPGMVGWRMHQVDSGIAAHRKAMRDIEQGVPAGWAALGMRARNVGG
jgi:hypothetical protein